jgi:hypothetical protein
MIENLNKVDFGLGGRIRNLTVQISKISPDQVIKQLVYNKGFIDKVLDHPKMQRVCASNHTLSSLILNPRIIELLIQAS